MTTPDVAAWLETVRKGFAKMHGLRFTVPTPTETDAAIFALNNLQAAYEAMEIDHQSAIRAAEEWKARAQAAERERDDRISENLVLLKRIKAAGRRVEELAERGRRSHASRQAALREIAEMRLDETVDAPIAQARARHEMHEIARRALGEK